MEYLFVPSKQALEKQQIQMNQELAHYGFHLSSAEIKQLLEGINSVCKKQDWIETDATILFRFVEKFQDHHFIKAMEFVSFITKVMDVYYPLRSIYSPQKSDDDLLDAMKLACLQNHGVMDEQTRHIVMKNFEREDKHARFSEL